MYKPYIVDSDRLTNGSVEFYKCTNRMYGGQTFQLHYKVEKRVWETNAIDEV